MPRRGKELCYLDNAYQYRTPKAIAKASTASSDGGDARIATADVTDAEAEGSGKRQRRLRRACTFCRRSHLVCEHSRPCQRCVKRDIAQACIDDHKEHDGSTMKPSARSPPLSKASDPSVTAGGVQSQRSTSVVSDAHHSFPPPSTSNAPPFLDERPEGIGSTSAAWDEALFRSFFYDQDFSQALFTDPALPDEPLQTASASQEHHTFQPPEPLGRTELLPESPMRSISALVAVSSPEHAVLYPYHPPSQSERWAAQRRSSSAQTQGGPTAAGQVVESSAQSTSVASRATDQPRRERIKWFEPLPFRKGYASIVRHLQQSNWQQTNVESVKKALASVCELWYSREDVMQFRDLIQVQAQWANNLAIYRDQVLPYSPSAMLACRKAGEIYAVNAPAQKLLNRPASDFEDGQMSVYQLMTEESAAHFFRLYEQAIRFKTLTASSENAVTLHWDARLIVDERDGGRTKTTVATRGVFHIKFSELELPCLLILSFVPL